MMMNGVRNVAARLIHARSWRSSHASLLWQHLGYRRRNRDAGLTDDDHLLAAAQWLGRAQDTAADGGIAGRYLLARGWTSSYPETTGYIIPTFLALAQSLDDKQWRDRAQRAVAFLLPLQLKQGGFPGLEIRENSSAPSVFNTAQILSGLLAWHAESGDEHVLEAACRAGDWLTAIQDEDGAWRQRIYKDLPVAYAAHASCWLAQLGQYTGRSIYQHAAAKHMDWVLTHRDRETGWIDTMGFTAQDHAQRRAVTHTIAYTLWGTLLTAEILDRSEAIDAVEQAATALALRLELSRRLPGVLDYQWRSQASFTCLTGNAQMALVWLRLFEQRGDTRLLNAAVKALDAIKAAQPMRSSNPSIRGAIPGSYPLWGRYLYMGLPNWAAKFFIDAILAKQQIMATISVASHRHRVLPHDLPESMPSLTDMSMPEPLKVVMYSRPASRKVPQMLAAWALWGFKPACVVIERRPELALDVRLLKKFKRFGLGGLLHQSVRRLRHRLHRQDPWVGETPDLLAFCKMHTIPIVEVERLDGSEAVAQLQAVQPDLAIHAGGGILRAPLLAIPRLGTLNAHMGLLPFYRGMNVAEWAVLENALVGCTVHLIDPGIDTGDILCVRRVATDGVCGIPALRARVDAAQLQLLGEVLQFILTTGTLPPRRPQAVKEGQQFFRMHPDLAAVVATRLRGESLRSDLSETASYSLKELD